MSEMDVYETPYENYTITLPHKGVNLIIKLRVCYFFAFNLLY